MNLSSSAKKGLAAGLAVSTLLWSVSLFALPAFVFAAPHSDGCLINSSGTIYLVSGGQQRGFPTAEVFNSHGYNFSQVVAASSEDTQAMGSVMVYADGTLVKGPSDPLVYLVANGQKRGFVSGSVYTGLGFNWANVVTAAVNTFADLPMGANLESATERHTSGVLVNDSGTIWQMTATGRKGVPSMEVFNSYGFSFARVVAANAADLAAANEGVLTARASCTGGGTTTPPPASGSLSVSLASSNPAAGTIIADTTSGDGAQAQVGALAVNFTAGSSAAVVTTVKVKRAGISSNSDVSNIYLYDGITRLAEYNSYAEGIATFTASAGLFTVPASSTRVITVKYDLANGTSSGKTLGFNLTDVSLSGGASVSGLPLSGNLMTTATVSDLGKLTINSVTTFPATVDPGEVDREVWRFNLVSADQDIEVSKLNLTLVGTVAQNDIQNVKLKVSGTQIGTTQQVMTNNEVTFDLSGSPYVIASGQTKTVVVHADIVGGTSRAFKFTIRKSSDVSVKDKNYGVWLKPNQTDTLTLIEPETGNGTDINAGTLTVTKATDSPSGNVTLNSSNVTLAKFNFKANGEDIKITTLVVEAVVSEDQQNLNNGKLLLDGSQINTTTDFDSDATDDGNFTDAATDAVGAGTDEDTSFSLGNTFIVPAGKTKVLTLTADTKDGDGNTLAASSTIRLSVGGFAATGQVSLASVTIASADGNLVTATSGALTIAKNTSVSDYTVANPTGVVGATGVKIGSLTITAGTGEAVSVTSITVGDDGDEATSDIGDNFQNLKMMQGSTQLGQTQGVLSGTAGADFVFTPSSAINVPAGQQVVLDFYADILTSAAGFATAQPGLEFVTSTATGAVTGADASDVTVENLHSLVIAAQGSLTVTANSGQPVAGQLVMGESDVTLAMFDLEAGSAEDLQITMIEVTDSTTSPNEFGGSLSNLKLFNGSTQVGATISSLSAGVDGVATFNLTTPLVVPRNATTTLTLKGSVNAYPNAVSGGTHVLEIAHATDDMTVIGASSGAAIAETISSAAGTAQDVYRTRAVVSLNSASPSGASSESTTSEVFRFDVAANSAYDAVVNAVAVTLSGNALLTGSNNANLYKSTDLNTALATEAYVTVTNAASGTTTTFVDTDASFDGIPVGATVRIYDDTAAAYATGTPRITSLASAGGNTTATFTPALAAANDVDVNDDMYYRPLQPGSGKLYFGAQTTLTADEANGSTSLNVTSTNGFAIGDTVTISGYGATGTALTSSAGGVISSIDDATSLTVSAVTLAATIDFDYVSASTANALTKNHNSAAVAYTGRLVSNAGQTVAQGTTLTFVVKGDTTGANASSTATETITGSLAAVGDLNWDDKVIFGIITDTKNIPVNGNTLQY